MIRSLLRSTRLPETFLARPATFAREEDGAATIVGLIFFAAMIIAGGFAMDIMRSENDRAELQYTLDRATLAAAALSQERDPKEVVEDYLRAAGFDKDDVRIQTFKTEEETRITVRGNSSVDSLFMKVIGMDTLETPVWSQAREEELRIEVSLVLDISGSMSGSKNEKMELAAKDFVDKLITGQEELTSVSVIPYNHAVNVGSMLSPYLNIDPWHVRSTCVTFDVNDFKTTSLATGTVLTRLGDFDRSDGGNREGATARPECPHDDYGAILPWSNDVAALQDHIDSLGARNRTAIDLGVKWGTLLLDPSLRGVHSNMITDGHVSTDLAGRPYNYDEPRTKKVLVVMTDGKNTTQYELKNHAKNGPTGIFVYNPTKDIGVPTAGATAPTVVGAATGAAYLNDGSPVSNWYPGWTTARDTTANDDYSGWWASSKRGPNGIWTGWDEDNNGSGTAWYTETFYSIWSQEKGKFYLPHDRRYADEPVGGTAAAEISYQELYAAVGTKFIQNKWFEQVDQSKDEWPRRGDLDGDGEPDHGDGFLDLRIDNATRNHFRNASKTQYGSSAADNNLEQICQAAGDQGIIIHTIAFLAPPEGELAMRDCAQRGADGDYHDVDDLDIDSAFNDILAAINALKLTR